MISKFAKLETQSRAPAAPPSTDGNVAGLQRFAMRHYSVKEIAGLWSLSDDAVRKIFEKEPGVLAIGDSSPTVRKRRYTTLRIPEDVLARVHRRLSKV
jgi:hypothetical protein